MQAYSTRVGGSVGGVTDNSDSSGHVRVRAVLERRQYEKVDEMDDAELTERLRRSAPAVVEPEGLHDHSVRIVADANRSGKRRLGGLVATAITGVLVVGSGTMAAATDGAVTPWGWLAENVFSFTRSDGTICYQGMQIVFDGIDEDAAIVSDARTILQGIDVESLDTTQVEKDLAWEATKSTANPDPINADELKQSAIGTMVADILFDELDELGYDLNPSPIALHTSTAGCSDD